ncbi:SF3 helicase domain-containing protein [Trichonephila clavata]|uniref:SF3 helicase domain-containing protein n=1 Tax=Trichonephila clavata TaxID=2740835 RepID=A0A8X6KIF7_TRICU|nr:SF3 helicase domain-containing protein [Trichonephila clavata]
MKGETSNGKSKLFEILARVFGGYYHCIQSDYLKPGSSSANPTPDLALTLFNCRIVTTEELEGKLNENRVKQKTGNSCVTFRNMYESSQGGIPTAKLFTTTNNLPDCRATEAFQDRVVAIPFMSRFVSKAPLTTSEQVRLNRYGKDEYVVERSYIGCFLILLYHLKKYMDIKNGLLHYRDEPPSVVEYTKIYLFNTDVYNQFKTHMDVQENLNTMPDFRSAVRQFLKSTKNNTTPKTDLILKFEEEFSEYRRRSDFQLGHYTSILDQTSDSLTLENTSLQEEAEEEGPKRSLSEVEGPRKRHCKSTETAVVYYENVIIRNLRKM